MVDLGWFGTGMMVTPFEEAVLTMEPNSISAPVETQFGWHVIKLLDSRLQDVPPLDDLREELTSNLEEAAIRDNIAKLQDAATIERTEGIDPTLMRDDALINN